jgi:hypothetical protein
MVYCQECPGPCHPVCFQWHSEDYDCPRFGRRTIPHEIAESISARDNASGLYEDVLSKGEICVSSGSRHQETSPDMNVMHDGEETFKAKN